MLPATGGVEGWGNDGVMPLSGGVKGPLGVLGVAFGLGWPYWTGVAIVAALLVWEHSIVKPNDMSRLTTAFFTINGYISTLVFTATAASLFL